MDNREKESAGQTVPTNTTFHTFLIPYDIPPNNMGPMAPVETSAPCASETDTIVVKKMAGNVTMAPAIIPMSV